MRALWAAEEIPDGSKGGGHIRQSYLFRALANSVPADLLLVGELHDDEVRAAAHVVLEQPRPTTVELRNRTLRRALNIANAAISPVPYELSRLTPVRRAVARELAERANDYDLVIVVHETLATALPRRRRGTWVVQFDHVLSEMYRQRAAAASGRQRWLHENDAHKAERLEQAAIGAWDSVVVCSAEDEALLGLTGSPRSIVAPNGADVSRGSDAAPAVAAHPAPGHAVLRPEHRRRHLVLRPGAAGGARTPSRRHARHRRSRAGAGGARPRGRGRGSRSTAMCPRCGRGSIERVW